MFNVRDSKFYTETRALNSIGSCDEKLVYFYNDIETDYRYSIAFILLFVNYWTQSK